ncbi:hypothetical protein [Ktedonospora formicarum]|uniref:Uncharacterized protein n=1 Tax=Ktedonospora formicarum TaxID=2778364 RepID=A0A8J3IAR1_9CHLR|nr:hypothetical protein [Ktedonospora formicarum]GHO48843.1 hypothetical protein KSX_70060 [Ktedonospora formicarum]
MGIGSAIATVIKGKILVTTLLGMAVIGGGTAAFAATPAGQNITKSITTSAHTATPTTANTKDQKSTEKTNPSKKQSTSQQDECPGLPEVQNLAKAFSLSTDSKSETIQLLCSLHTGDYKGLDHALGYGEINDLLTYAQYLAGQEKNATDAKLSDETLSTYITKVLQTCANDPISACVKANMPTDQGKSDSNSGDTNRSKSGTPTKPTVTPGKPTVTPTPHH